MDETINILIVDDDEAILETLEEFLGMHGHRCYTAESAEDGIVILEKKPVHIVISDIMLPGMNGMKFCEYLKDGYNADVILITGYSDDYSYEEAIRSGARDFVFKPVRLQELLLRIRRVLRERKLEAERASMLRKLEKLAITDDLTGLYNFRHFYTQLESEVMRANRYSSPLSLLLMDIDHFKRFNDRYGHLEGDKVLARIATITQSCLRTTDSAYRYGGEEFTIILPETSWKEAENVGQRIRAKIESESFMPAEGKKVTVTISIGVTQYAEKEKLSTFIRRSDEAMYASKQDGRNRVSCLFGNPD